MTYRPQFDLDRDAFVERTGEVDDRPVVVRTTALLDVEASPLSAYAALTDRVDSTADGDVPSSTASPYTFLLESAEKTASSDPDGAFRPSHRPADRHARYSYVGVDPQAVVSVWPDSTTVEALDPDGPGDLLERNFTDAPDDADVFDRLRLSLPVVRLENVPDRDRQHFDGGLVGFLSYEAVYDCWLDEVGLDRPETALPDAQFVFTTSTLAFDHHEGTLSVICTPFVTAADDPGRVYDGLQDAATEVAATLERASEPDPGGFVRRGETAGDREDYERIVERANEHVLDGDIYQGVFSRSREYVGEVDPLGLYASLREVNPSPYMYLLEYDEHTVVGASPETLVSVSGQEVVANPIAGTCPRGESPVDDRRLAGEMLADEKERAEHTMLVDLARNDVRRVAEPGSVRVEEFMNVLKYSHVQHIESTVTATMAADADAFDATRATFPAGTLTGAPKIRAMELIDEYETTTRGLYGGGIGYYSWNGDADFAIVIRTATIREEPDGQRIRVRAGAGIVADSDPAAEYDETERKMDGVVAALERIEVDPAEEPSVSPDGEDASPPDGEDASPSDGEAVPSSSGEDAPPEVRR